MDCSTPGFLSFVISWCLLKLMSIKSVIPSNHIILCHPPLLLLSIFPRIRVFSNVSCLHQVAKALEFQLQYQSWMSFQELISFRTNWFDLLTLQRDSQESSPTPQLESINSSALSFIMVQLLYPYMATGKTIVVQSHPTPCDSMDYSKPGFPILHHLPELAQSHIQ